jgi:hypothetical protein
LQGYFLSKRWRRRALSISARACSSVGIPIAIKIIATLFVARGAANEGDCIFNRFATGHFIVCRHLQKSRADKTQIIAPYLGSAAGRRPHSTPRRVTSPLESTKVE